MNDSYINLFTSGAIKFGTSPVFKTLLISSKKLSLTIYVSLNKNKVYWFLDPAYLSSFLRSSFHAASL